MFNADGGNQTINRTDLNPFSPKRGPEMSRFDVGRAVGDEERERFQTSREALKLAPGTKAIQQFLENIADQEEAVFSSQVTVKGYDERIVDFRLRSSKDQGPHRRVNDEIHDRADQLCNPNPCEIQTSRTRAGFYVAAAVG